MGEWAAAAAFLTLLGLRFVRLTAQPGFHRPQTETQIKQDLKLHPSKTIIEPSIKPCSDFSNCVGGKLRQQQANRNRAADGTAVSFLINVSLFLLSSYFLAGMCLLSLPGTNSKHV